VHVVPWCPSARVLRGRSALESLWFLESLRPRKEKKEEEQGKKERRKTGESIFGLEPLCAAAARHQMKMRTNTHTYLQYRHDGMEYIQSIRQPNGAGISRERIRRKCCCPSTLEFAFSFAPNLVEIKRRKKGARGT